jgi:phosphoglycerol transferase MdoB-like AlkP superfamily enzyme
MLKINSSWLGAFLGLALPSAVFFFDKVMKSDLSVLGKENVFYMLSAAANLLLFRFYIRSGRENTAYGILASTFFCAFVLLILKGHQ